MAFSGNFTITPTSDPATFILTDTSTGTDGTITGRTVNLIQSDGTNLVSEITWAIASTTKTITVLTQDTALNVVVDWITESPTPGYTYEKIILACFDGFGNQFGFNTWADINSNPGLLQSQNFLNSLLNFTVLITGAENATTIGGSITLTQELLDSEIYMQQNSQTLFA